jgi:hypothetical protein
MSQLEKELNLVRIRLAALEEQKRIEIENVKKKKAFPLDTLEDIIIEKRKQIERNSYSKSLSLAKFYDEEKLAVLEPIFDMLKNIQERLVIIEKNFK